MKTSLIRATLAALTATTLALPAAAADSMDVGAQCQPKAVMSGCSAKCAGRCAPKKHARARHHHAAKSCAPKCAAQCAPKCAPKH